MNRACETYTDALVEHAAGRLPAARLADLEAHLADCGACRAELAVVRCLRSSPVTTPPGLETRIREAVLVEARPGKREPAVSLIRPRRGRARAPWLPWALPAAAAATLALVWAGLGGRGSGSPAEDAATLATTESYEPFGAWPASDGIVAGEPVLVDLSEEQLQTLLEDMES